MVSLDYNELGILLNKTMKKCFSTILKSFGAETRIFHSKSFSLMLWAPIQYKDDILPV